MPYSSAEPATNYGRSLFGSATPWLLSTTVHSLLFVMLLLGLQWGQRSWHGTGSHGVQVSLDVSAAGDGAGTVDAAGLEQAILGSQLLDDDPGTAAQAVGPPHEGGGTTLADLPDEQPAVDLAGPLPGKTPAVKPASAAANSAADDSGSGVDNSASGVGGGSGAGAGPRDGVTTRPKGSNRPGGGYARTGVFGTSGEGHKFVYVFDRSGSMDGRGGAPLSAAKAELIASLKDLGPTHEFQIIFYNDEPRVFSPTGVRGRLVFGTDQNKYLAQKFVGSITANGSTRHEEALDMALRMAPDVIFFLTDADEPRLTTEQLARVAQRNRGTSIHAIEFGYGPQLDPDNFLVKLARQNGGQHVYVDVSKLPAGRR